MSITKGLIALLLAGSMSACTSNLIKQSASTVISKNTNGAITVIDVRNRNLLSKIVPELIKSKVVLVGESHTTYSDHQNQLAVIKAMRPHWSNMGVGLEFIQSPYQKVLDAYVAGDIDDAEMLKKTQWYQRWKYDFRLYREIFHYAKKYKIPLFALNAPTELTKKISKKGIAGLTAEDRRYLPKKITRDKAYRDRLLKVFHQHSQTSSKKLDRFVDVQLAWDESMAMNAAKAIQSGRVNKMIVLAGSGHVIRQGIPVRLDKRLATKSMIIVNQFEEDLSQIDFVLQGKNIKLPLAGKIGIMMVAVEGKQAIKVDEVLKKHKGGLKKGDVILAINGQKIESIGDVKINLLDKRSGEVLKMKIQRANKTINHTLKLL
ncbi:MAG: ChaN family lipoprotein [Gammaproteobacteria bacterium]|nr:ChaN family lipoprotein [Gammaproteobacteria bacterium]